MSCVRQVISDIKNLDKNLVADHLDADPCLEDIKGISGDQGRWLPSNNIELETTCVAFSTGATNGIVASPVYV